MFIVMHSKNNDFEMFSYLALIVYITFFYI